MPTIFHRRAVTALYLFLAGVIVTLLVLRFPAAREVFTNIEQARYAGAFLAGLLYSVSFTSASATVVIANFPDDLNIVLVALIAGSGGLVYDLLVFSFFRHERDGILHRVTSSLAVAQSPVPRWAYVAIGLVILASPLPDELAAGLLGLSRLSAMSFIGISFFANSAGVLLIQMVS